MTNINPVSWDCRICQLHFCRGVTLFSPLLSNECPGYGIKPSDGEALQEIWGMWSTPSLPLLPGSLWPGMVVPVRIPFIDQIELCNHLLYHLTVCKQMSSGLFKNVTLVETIHLKIIYMYLQDLALNNHQGLICH